MNAVESFVHEFDGELRVSSEKIAAGVGAEHRAVLQLIGTHVDHLERFGPLAFEMRMGAALPQGGFGKSTRIAQLTEQQVTLLMTFMKNTAPVIAFKVAVVDEFYRMRQALAKPAELSTLQIIELAREAELARIAAEQKAVAESARADATQMILDNVDRSDGIVVRAWLKKYFPPRQEQKLWALFYAKRMLKNGLGQGGTDRKGKPKSSRDHQSVLTDGQSFFIRTLKKDFVGDDVKRYETKVRPGRAELELVAYCEKNGIAPLPEVSQALFEINDLSKVFAPPGELAA